MSNQRVTIDLLLNLVPDAADSVLSHLRAHPELAAKQDAHGYSLIHAATSYEQLDLLKALVTEFHVDPNITDEDGETCLFNAETVDIAKELVQLGVTIDAKNSEGQTAAEKLNDEDEQPEVSAYLQEISNHCVGSSDTTAVNGQPQAADLPKGESRSTHAPPPLPNGVQVNIGTMQPNDVGGEPDPEFRRRIEELAARQDFDGQESQRELRDLVSEAVSGFNHEGHGPSTRRRIG